MFPKLSEIFTRTKRRRILDGLDITHLAVCFFVIGLGVAVLGSGRLERLETLALDYFFRNQPARPPHPGIALIEIDKESLEAIGPWPWPWRYHAQMIKLLERWQAQAVIFDFFFREAPDAAESEKLEELLESTGKIYLPVLLEPKEEKKIWVHSLPIVLEEGGTRLEWARSDPELEARAKALGHIKVEPDFDGVVRRIRPFLSYGAETYPSLGLKAAFDSLGADLAPETASRRLGLDHEGHMIMAWNRKSPPGFEKFSYADLIRSEQAILTDHAPVVDPSRLKGKICLIGLADPALTNLFVSPLEPGLTGIRLQAEVIESVLSGRTLRPAGFLLNAFVLCMIGFAASMLFAVFRTVQAFVAGLFMGLGWAGVSLWFLASRGIWFHTVQPLAMILLLFIFSAIYSQISAKREQARLYHLATRDGLTGLYVIRHFREVLNAAVLEAGQKREPLCVILLDLDNFKPINDTYGHPAGDMVLKKVADVIRICFRARRTVQRMDFAARYGGEEFIIMLRGSTLKDAAFKAAERVRKAVHETVFEWDAKAIPVTVSVGVASLHEGEHIPDLMVRRADEALYRAKKTGKNRVCIETFAGS